VCLGGGGGVVLRSISLEEFLPIPVYAFGEMIFVAESTRGWYFQPRLKRKRHPSKLTSSPHAAY
jgi:hypothetical protein